MTLTTDFIRIVSNPQVQMCLNEKKQRRIARLVPADRKGTVTRLTNFYHHGKQKSISDHTTCRPLSQEQKMSLQWAKAHQNWPVEDWKGDDNPVLNYTEVLDQ